jgi:hypothetical protein
MEENMSKFSKQLGIVLGRGRLLGDAAKIYLPFSGRRQHPFGGGSVKRT